MFPLFIHKLKYLFRVKHPTCVPLLQYTDHIFAILLQQGNSGNRVPKSLQEKIYQLSYAFLHPAYGSEESC